MKTEPIIWDMKSPSAEYKLRMNMLPQLAAGDKLTSARVDATGANLVVSRVSFTDTEIFFWVSGGTRGLVATIDFTGTTQGGETVGETSRMAVG